MKKLLYTGLAALMILLFSLSASAATMDVTYGDLKTVSFDYDSPDIEKTMSSGYAAVFGITLNDGIDWIDFSTIAYCVDLDHLIYEEPTYEVTLNPVTLGSSNYGSDNYLQAAWLMDTWSTDASTDAQKAAGLQLAIWDAIYGDNFENKTYGNIGDYYSNYYLSSLGLTNDDMWSSLGYNYAVTTYLGDDIGQKLLVQLDPVPEPGTMLLLGMGIAGLGAAGRKRFRKQ